LPDDLTAAEDLPDDLTAALAWLHYRLGHSFTVSMGYQPLGGAVLRGREPSLGASDDGSYVLDVFARVASIAISRDQLCDVEILDNGDVLRLTMRGRAPLEIVDEG
jgi:hypothetical protein